MRSKVSRHEVEQTLLAMQALQLHRGPDDQGVLIEQLAPDIVLGMGHQRLSILDLSHAGHQPMETPCGRYALIYNGEVYNYPELARELAGDPILDISHGDTAVVLAALAKWGHKALTRFNGMWSLVFFDRREKRMLVSRDRLGIKPLYVHCDGAQFILASEVKGVLEAVRRPLRLNRRAIARYLRQSLLNTECDSFFEDIHAVPPGNYAEFDVSSIPKSVPAFTAFWQHPYERGASAESRVPTALEIRECFFDAVKLRLRSDVPVGILLSGGIDSSSMLAAAARSVNDPSQLQALSVVSRDPRESEEAFIDCVSAHVGCQLHKVQIDDDPMALLRDLSDTCWYNDQPVINFSAVAHRRLMARAQDHGITVILTGQGADEQLAGYNKFFYFYLMELLRGGRWGHASSILVRALTQGTVVSEFDLSYAKRYLPKFLSTRGASHIGEALMDEELADTGLGNSFVQREWKDMRFFSVPTLLHYEDRMSMSHSKEMRVPFLDYRLVEKLALVPPAQKLEKGWPKAIFRKAMADYLPEQITWRRDKKGFNIPERQWLRSHFRQKFENTLSGPMLAVDQRLLNRDGAVRLLRRHLSGDKTATYLEVFSVYCLETWLRRYEPYIAA